MALPLGARAHGVRASHARPPTASRTPLVVQASQQRRWSLAAGVLNIWRQHQQQQQQQQWQQQAAGAADGGDASMLAALRAHGASMGAVVLPFAATSLSAAGSGSMSEVYYGLGKAIDLYLLVLTLRVLLSWFRNINWYGEPWNTLRQLTDPFLSLFRGVVPPLGGIDLSPMLGFLLLNVARNFLLGMA